METYLALDKGLHTDFEPINQPAGTYRYMLNAIRQLSGAIENEKGTKTVKAYIGKQRVLGSYILDTDIILCTTDGIIHEIGILDKNDNYTIVTNNPALAFTFGSIIKMEGKKNFKGERIIYLVEKNGFNPMRAINIDDKALLASPTFGDDIKLQINPNTPTITVDSVVDGGSLPTGVYQATARLLTRSTNPTPFGIVSPLVSIIDDSTDIPIDQQDGAIPGSTSPKAINFLISGIDTSYSFIEVAIITYTGTANISSTNLVARLPIDGRESISFTYSSIDQNKESIDLEAIAIKPVIYDTASTIVQKDGILTVGNLTATSDTFDYQGVANLVKLKYFIDEVPYIPGYKDPILGAKKRGYMRDEVYSFALVPEYEGQYNTTAYHIPGIGNGALANVITRELGTYVSDEEYPLDKGYPVGNVLHHKMPNANQEPLIITKNGIQYIRIIGIEVDLSAAIAVIPADTLNKIKGFSLVRQVRKDADKSILAQGIAATHFTSTGGGMPNAKYLAPTPKSLNNLHLFNSSVAVNNEIGFFSPETVIYQSNLVGNLSIKVVGQLNGTQSIVDDLRTHDADGQVPANFKLFLDYTGMSNASSANITIQSNSAQYIKEDSATLLENNTILINGTNGTINNYKSNGYLYLKLGNRLPIREQSFGGKPEFYYEYRGTSSTDAIYLNGVEYVGGTSNRSSTSDRYLYNIVRSLERQYGAIYDATYIYCGTVSLVDGVVGRVYGGDIFINKFGVVTMGASKIGDDEIDYKVLSYFFCESTINTAYRHYSNPVGLENQSGFIPGTTPYYPKLSILYNDPEDKSLTPGILNLSWTLGHGRGYNKQYSFENTIIVYYPKQLAEEKVTKFGNRVIYSEQSVEGEQIDSYRIFLPNNYHDVPKDKGEITELFTHNNNYYIHTSGALYRSSFNERVSQATSVGDVYLGNGGVFSRPSQPILTMDGGYAGTSSSCGINTPYGRMFIDNQNGKVYLLGSEDSPLKEISNQGMFKYFSKEIEDLKDSPATNMGYVSGYDQENQRIVLTRLDANNHWTLSYSLLLNSWSSYHTYVPYHYIYRGQQFYSIVPDGLYRHNVGLYGAFYNNLYPMQLDIVLNDAPNTTKTFDNLVFYTTSQNADAVEQHFDTFSTLHAYNTTRNTGKCRLIVPRNYQEDFQTLGLYECFAKLKSNEFRVAIPNDLVVDVNESIFTATNLANNRNYRPSMSGKWLLVSLAYNNLRNHKFVVHTVGRIFRHRIR